MNVSVSIIEASSQPKNNLFRR